MVLWEPTFMPLRQRRALTWNHLCRTVRDVNLRVL